MVVTPRYQYTYRKLSHYMLSMKGGKLVVKRIKGILTVRAVVVRVDRCDLLAGPHTARTLGSAPGLDLAGDMCMQEIHYNLMK